MDASIDFLAENLLSTLHCQRSHLLAQCLTGLNGLLIGFSTGSSDDFVSFVGSAGLGFFNDGLCTAIGVRKTRSCFVARL